MRADPRRSPRRPVARRGVRARRRRRRMSARRRALYLRFAGKLLISVGVGVVLFVAWMLWGTGIYAATEQEKLAAAFAELPSAAESDSALPAGERQSPPDFAPRPGAPAFRLRVPEIDVDEIVVEGVATEHLMKGPGHYPACSEDFPPPLCIKGPPSFPGDPDRVAISGHRTTYGAPFGALDELDAGDEIITETTWGTFVYRVTTTSIVDPDVSSILRPTGVPELVLATCHPRYSAEKRLIVFAELEQPTASRQ